jgi:diguanylate cyclase (GGDEF)-like protein
VTNRIERILARRADPDRDPDRDLARRYAGLLWLLQSGLIAVVSPLAPPTHALGAVAGWVIFALLVASGLLIGGILLLRGPEIGDWTLFALQSLAVLELAVLAWFADRYSLLSVMLLWVVSVSASHPPRRAIPFFAFVALALVSPVLYRSWGVEATALVAAQLATWAGLAAVVMYWTQEFREERFGLTRSGREAMRLAITDPLTGLPNRRAFEEMVRGEFAKLERSPRPLTLVLADLDGFKEINDEHGHLHGDVYLRRVAVTIASVLREGDTCFRWGGDEFAIVLPGTVSAEAEFVCARVGTLMTANLRAIDGVSISLTFGMAEYAPPMSPVALVAAADRDLMARKSTPHPSQAGSNA